MTEILGPRSSELVSRLFEANLNVFGFGFRFRFRCAQADQLGSVAAEIIQDL